MLSRTVTYEHSGTVPPVGALGALAVAALAASVLAPIYAYAIYYIPIVYFNVILTGLFGAAIGWVAFKVGRALHVRSTSGIAVIALLAAVWGHYVGWIAWIFALSAQQALVVDPLSLYGAMSEIAAIGPWSIFGTTMTGWKIVLVWLAETVIVLGAAALIASSLLSDEAYCERCARWLAKGRKSRPLGVPERPDALVADLQGGGSAQALELVPAAEGEPPAAYMQLTLHSCDRCSEMDLLTTEVVTREADDKGKIEEKRKALQHFLRIDRPTRDRFLERHFSSTEIA